MPEYAPHGNYVISLDPEHDRVIRIAASGAVNLEILRIHNDRTNLIVDGFAGQPYGMVCDFNGGFMIMHEADSHEDSMAWVLDRLRNAER